MNTPSLFPSAKARKFRRDREAVRRAQIVQATPGYAINTDPLLNAKEAAAYLTIHEATLQKWRTHDPDRIKFIKVGSHRVRYRRSALDEYLARQEVTSGAGVTK